MRRLGLIGLLLLPFPVGAQKAALQRAAPGAAAPTPTATFVGDVGPFHVVAAGGRATFGADTVTLTGSVALYPKARPDLRVTLSGGSVKLSGSSANQRASTTYRNAVSNGRVGKVEQNQTNSAHRDAQIASKQVEVDKLRGELGALEQRFAQNGKLSASESTQLGRARNNLAGLQRELAVLKNEDKKQDQYDSALMTGLLETTLAGIPIRIPNVSASLASDATLAFTGGSAPVKGCTHDAANGSRLNGLELALAGTLRCGQVSIGGSTLKLSTSALSGQGRLQAAGRWFDLTYAAGNNLQASGAWSGASPGFQRVPGFDTLEFQAHSPKLRFLIDGPSAKWEYSASKIELRTAAMRPSGEPWSKGEISPNTFVVPAAPPPAGPGGIPIPYPNLAHPGDPLRSARDACLAAASKVPDNPATKTNERDAAVSVCHASNPQPPAIPTLPATVSVPIEKLIK